MTDLDQIDYFSTRAQQQRDLAARATMPDIKAFHLGLAVHYERLLEQVQQIGLLRARDPLLA